jgi:hypothetical protein
MSFADLVERADRAAQDHLGGVTVTYAPAVGAAVEVVGIFDEVYRLLDPGEAGVEQVTPAVFFRLDDLPVHPDEDEPELTIEGLTYQIRERQPDGQGGIRLLLHRSA